MTASLKGPGKKEYLLLGIARKVVGGRRPLPEFSGSFSPTTFFVNKKSLFLQKISNIQAIGESPFIKLPFVVSALKFCFKFLAF